MLSPFRFHGFALGCAVPAHLRFAPPAVRYSMEHTFDYTVILFSPSATPISGPLPTMASADFSQFVVTTVSFTACETSRDKPASLSSSTRLIYTHGLRLPLGLRCLVPAYPPCAPYIRFLFVRLRFRFYGNSISVSGRTRKTAVPRSGRRRQRRQTGVCCAGRFSGQNAGMVA